MSRLPTWKWAVDTSTVELNGINYLPVGVRYRICLCPCLPLDIGIIHGAITFHHIASNGGTGNGMSDVRRYQGRHWSKGNITRYMGLSALWKYTLLYWIYILHFYGINDNAWVTVNSDYLSRVSKSSAFHVNSVNSTTSIFKSNDTFRNKQINGSPLYIFQYKTYNLYHWLYSIISAIL